MKLSNPCSQCGETRYPLTKGLCPKCQKREYRKEPCSHPGCHRKRTRRNLCEFHVKEYLEKGLITLMDQSAKTCTVPGCNKPHKALGLCVMHWKRQKNRENPNFRERATIVKEHPIIETTSSDGQVLNIQISSKTLCDRSGIPRNALVPVLKKLQNEGIVHEFSIGKDEVVSVKVSSQYEIAFNSGLNLKPPGVLESPTE